MKNEDILTREEVMATKDTLIDLNQKKRLLIFMIDKLLMDHFIAFEVPSGFEGETLQKVIENMRGWVANY